MRASRAGEGGGVGDVRAWATGAAGKLHGDVSAADAGETNWGMSYQHSRALRFGAGARFTAREGDLPVFDGEAEIDAYALQGFAAYEPNDEGLRVYLGAIAGHHDVRIDRGYLNGVTLVRSGGERHGGAFGASIIAGWRAPISEAVEVTPFVRFDATRIELSAYEESGGPFPARFDEVDP